MAADLGIAGVIIQEKNNREKAVAYFSRQTKAIEKNNREKAVAYFSRQTTAIEQNYNLFELEALAINESKKIFIPPVGEIPYHNTNCATVPNTFKKSKLNIRISDG